MHFSLIPQIYESEKIYTTDLQILHYSTDTKEKREKKYIKYKNNDKDQSQSSYEHIIVENPITNEFKPIY